MGERDRNPLEHVLTAEERARVFAELIVPFELRDLREARHPGVRYVGGQPGAGKSSLQSQIMAALQEIDGPRSAVEINNDRYRVHHHSYRVLRERDEEAASFYTNEDCAHWIARALDIAFERLPHILLESSLRKPDEVITTIERGHQQGFTSPLDVVVAHEFESRLSIAERYFAWQIVMRFTQVFEMMLNWHQRCLETRPDTRRCRIASGCDRVMARSASQTH